MVGRCSLRFKITASAKSCSIQFVYNLYTLIHINIIIATGTDANPAMETVIQCWPDASPLSATSDKQQTCKNLTQHIGIIFLLLYHYYVAKTVPFDWAKRQMLL